MTTSTISTAHAKEHFTDMINRVAHHKERIILTRRGKEVAVVISVEDFQLLHQSQDKNDLQEAIDALKESRQVGALTLEQLIKEAGIVP